MLQAVGERGRREALAAEDRRRALLAAAQPAAELLVQRFGVTAVWLFGSVVTGRVGPRSDLDLAVTGLDEARYFEALAALDDVTPLPVDLVPLEEASAAIVAEVRAHGRQLR